MQREHKARVRRRLDTGRTVPVPSDWPEDAVVTVTLDELPDPGYYARFDDNTTGVRQTVFVVERREMTDREDLDQWQMAWPVSGWGRINRSDLRHQGTERNLVLVRRKP